MNIYTQVCGLIIVVLLLVFYRKQPTMGLSSEKRFITTLYAILGCVVLDIASCFLIVNASKYNSTIVLVTCKLYLLSLQTVSYCALAYTVADIFRYFGSEFEKFLGRLFRYSFIIGLFITTYLPIEYYYDGRYLYSYGKAAIATYIFVAIHIILIIASTMVLKKHIKQQKTNALLIWMLIWICSAVIQFFKPQLLIVSFSACIGALIMFFELENPQSVISRKTGHFSSAVIYDYLDYLYKSKTPFSAMIISFNTLNDTSSENKILRKTINTLSDFLFSIKAAKVFDTAEGYFFLIFNNKDFLENTKFKIETYFQSIEDNADIAYAYTLLHPYYTIIPDSHIAADADDLMLLVTNFVPNNHNNLITNEVIIDKSAMDLLRNRKQVEKMVISAMEDNRIEVHYQPIYNIASGIFTGIEALVRIRLNDGTLVYPNDFIPIVEETGRIVPLSDTIYKNVLSFIKSYRIEKLGIEKVELNLSVKHGESPVFVSRILEALQKEAIEPKLINFEITETYSIRSKENLAKNMEKLKEHGISFSLDDFGAGSSNLNYIVDMPVDIVKLDMHLTEEYFTNAKAKAIVKTVVDMAHSMGLRIIAEGIETKQQMDEMKSLGVDYLQGYYFSHPLPEHEILKFLQQNNL